MISFSSQDFAYLGLLLVSGYVINFYLNYFRRPDKLPGPLPLPLIGNLHQYTDMSTLGKLLESNYGDMGEIWIGGERAIWLGRTEYLEKIFKTSGSNYNLRTIPSEGLDMLDMTSKGIFLNRNHGKWSANRKCLTKGISASFVKQSVKINQTLFSEMEKYWEDLKQRNIEIDMANWARRLFAESIFLLTTNIKCNALKNHYEVLSSPEKNADNTETLINYVKAVFGVIEFFFLVPKFLHVLPNYGKRVKQSLDSFDWARKHYLLSVIKERRKEIEKTPLDQELTPNLLNMMLTLNTSRDTSQGNTIDKSLKPLSDEDICQNLFEVALGGTETTSNAFCYIVYYLCQYPEVQRRVSEEIHKVFGSNSKININHEELSKLHYCEAVIKEVTRVKPVAPFLLRMAENSDEINGHKIKASTQILIDVQEIHSSKLYWKEPETFNPERFLSSTTNDNDDGEIKRYSFLAFGGGARMCPGRALAMAELKTMMVSLFGKYNVDFVDRSAPLKSHCTLINHCDELKIKLSPK